MVTRIDSFVFLLFLVLAVYCLNLLGALILLLFDSLFERLFDLFFSRILHIQRENYRLRMREDIVHSFSVTSCFMVFFLFLYWYLHFREVGL